MTLFPGSLLGRTLVVLIAAMVLSQATAMSPPRVRDAAAPGKAWAWASS